MSDRGYLVFAFALQPSLANDTSCESNVTTPPNPLRDASNPAGYVFFVTDASLLATGGIIQFPFI